MTEFDCLIKVRVSATDGVMLGESTLVLPFAPFVGLGITGILAGSDAIEVQDVAWDTVAQGFVLHLEDDETALELHRPRLTLEQMKDLYGGDWTWTDEATPV